MKMIYLIMLGLVIAGGLYYYLTPRKNSETVDNPMPGSATKSEDNPYLGLRGQVFDFTPDQIGIAPSEEEKAYAVVMDVSLGPDGTMTLVSFIDGNASIYLSSGGGMIGLGTHESVRKAAIAFVNAGEKQISKMNSTASFPLPKMNHVRFYVLTNKGKYSVEEEMDKLENGASRMESLFFTGDKVITEIRLISEKK